jgi:hypothetical protein
MIKTPFQKFNRYHQKSMDLKIAWRGCVYQILKRFLATKWSKPTLSEEGLRIEFRALELDIITLGCC